MRRCAARLTPRRHAGAQHQHSLAPAKHARITSAHHYPGRRPHTWFLPHSWHPTEKYIHNAWSAFCLSSLLPLTPPLLMFPMPSFHYFVWDRTLDNSPRFSTVGSYHCAERRFGHYRALPDILRHTNAVGTTPAPHYAARTGLLARSTGRALEHPFRAYVSHTRSLGVALFSSARSKHSCFWLCCLLSHATGSC